jgi:AcrR family transcriptional regulator
VDVSARTFHRYFASKDDVLFADAEERRRMVAEVLANRPDDESILDDLRAGALALVNATQPRAAEQARKLQIIESSDRLRARSLRGSEELADVFAAHVATRLGVTPDDARARLLGTWALGAIRTSHRRWLADPRLDLASEVDAAFSLLTNLPEGLHR